ncbi:MAG: head-tail adaptor protein [Fusobacteriaceae bacterium]
MKNLSSSLNNRIEIWGEVKEKIDIGSVTKDKLIKKVWADIVPQSGSTSNGPGDTIVSNSKFKARMRKTELSPSNFIIFKGQKYEIDYILPDFNKNNFIDVYLKLSIE